MAEAVVSGATDTGTGPAARSKRDIAKGPKEDITGIGCPTSSRKKNSPKGDGKVTAIGEIFMAMDKLNKQRKEDKLRSRSGKIPLEKSRVLQWDDKDKGWKTYQYEWDEI